MNLSERISEPVVSTVNELQELHEYLDETIDGVNEMNRSNITRFERIEKELKDFRQECGMLLKQIHAHLADFLQTEQETQKQARAKLRALSSMVKKASERF